MNKKLLAILLCMSQSMLAFAEDAGVSYYGTGLCGHPEYDCVVVNRSTSWKNLFPDEQQRDIVQRVNRTYNYLYRGKKLAIPKNIESKTIFDVAPFSLQIKPSKDKMIIVDQDKLAWGAYDRDGKLVKWGPISSGKDYCPDIGRACRTQTGVFRVFDKQNSKCRSRMFRANMPYCMFFYKGFALHGSNDIPGKRASHGCVRMFEHDAKWLNHNFVEVSRESNGYKGTKVIVQKLSQPNKKVRSRRRR